MIAVETPCARFYVSTADEAVGRSLFVHGLHEAPLMEAALDSLARAGVRAPDLHGGVFIDVGANIGSATVTAMRRFGAPAALSLEPHPANIRLLEMNLVANALRTNVTTVQAAITDHEGEVLLAVAEGHSGDHRVRTAGGGVADELGESRRATIPVRATTLDGAMREHNISTDDVSLVWIDTQGHEAHVLAGAPDLLRSQLPVLIEFWPYGLREAGGLQRLIELLCAHYTHFVDLGARVLRAPQPTNEVGALVPRHEGPGNSTDLLLLKR